MLARMALERDMWQKQKVAQWLMGQVCTVGLVTTLFTGAISLESARAAKAPAKPAAKPAAAAPAKPPAKAQAKTATPPVKGADAGKKPDAKSAVATPAKPPEKPVVVEPPFDDWVGQTEGIAAGSLGQPENKASVLVADPDAKDAVTVQWLFVVISVICMCLSATLLFSLPPKKRAGSR